MTSHCYLTFTKKIPCNSLEVIEKARVEQGLSVVELCSKAKVSRCYWYRLKQGIPSEFAKLEKICQVLNLSSNLILESILD